MGQILAFVVARAPRKERAALNARLERRGLPKLERFRRLHVVMSIDDKVGTPGSGGIPPRCFGDDDGIALSRTQSRVQAYLPALSEHPLGTGLQVAAMLGLRRNTGKPDVLTQLAYESRLVFF